jgi:tetratricopeptide (TPR) repeat protein
MKQKTYFAHPVILLMLVFTLLQGSNETNIEEMKRKFTQQFNPIKTKITTKGTTFSFSKTKKELDRLYKVVQHIGIGSPELCEWYDIYTLLLSKREDEAYQLIPYGTRYIQECTQSQYPSKTVLPFIHFRMYKAYNTMDDSITQRTKHFKQFLTLWEKHKLYDSQSQLLGQKEQLAYLLQENKEYAKALNLNLHIETKAHKLNLPEEEFMTLYNNIAQNYYDLKEPKRTKEYLDKRLALSQKYGDIHTELDTLFQLAVLAYETGDSKTAEKLFKHRLKLANTHQDEIDSQTIDSIKRDLASFYKKTHAKQ